MTEQEIFDKVATHLLKQGTRSIQGNTCLYRCGELKCAVGCLIPDELYDEGIEGVSVRSEVVVKLLSEIGILPYGPSFDRRFQLLRELQAIHDLQPIDMWRVALVDVADVFGLQKEAMCR